MADDPIPSAEPEISAPPSVDPPRPARADPGVIDGEATEIHDAAAEAPPADAPRSPEVNRLAPYAIPAAAGLGGAILGAALALFAAWLIDPRAGALDAASARLAAVEKSAETQSAATAALDKRVATIEAGTVKASALETSGADAKAALDEARAARADAAKALSAAQAAPATTNGAAPAEPSALEPRLAKLESDLAAAEARLNQLGAFDERLSKLEGAAGAAPKSDARVAMAKGASESAASVAVLALSLEQRFAAGAPFAAEVAALSQLGVAADAPPEVSFPEHPQTFGLHGPRLLFHGTKQPPQGVKVNPAVAGEFV